MTSVSLEGRLGQIVGSHFSFKTRTLREVLDAIEANTGKFRNYLLGNGKRMFAIFVDGKELDPVASLNTNVRNKKITIIPLLFGAFVASLTAAIVGAMAVTGVAAKVATFVVGTVLSAALSFGISLLISKIMKQDDPEALNTSSFLFGQAENVTKQGVVVPVGYGRMQVGSRVISVNLFNIDRSKYDNSGAGLYDVLKIQEGNREDAEIVNDGVIQVSNVFSAGTSGD
jgi:predicted phage tail protein